MEYEKLDRSAFKGMTVQEADMEMRNHKSLSPEQRLKISFYLISVAYQFPISSPPRLDKTAFQALSRSNG